MPLIVPSAALSVGQTILQPWIRGSASQWKPFVANRVSEIQWILDPSVWNYCPGLKKPADLPTWGLSVSQLMENQFWWKGASWLQESF